MNPAAACLSAAGLVGLAAAWLGWTWWRLLEAALPAPRPPLLWALPCVLAAAAVGAVFAVRRTRAPLAAARRALVLGAAAALCTRLAPASAVPGPAAILLAVAPAALAAACLAAGLVRLGSARGAARAPPTRALAGTLAALAAGIGAGCATYIDVLEAFTPTTGAALALLAAALLCGPPLCSAGPTAPPRAPAAAPGSGAEAAARPSASVAHRREQPPRVAFFSPCLAGVVLALAPPALTTLLDQWHGAALITRTELGLGLACGGVLAGLLPGLFSGRAIGVRGLTMIALALALSLPHWLPGVVLERLPGWRAALVLGLPVGFCVTGLIVIGARPGRAGWLSRAGPLALAACGATLGALVACAADGADAGTSLRALALVAAVLSVPASLAARPPGRSFSAWVRRWTASGLGVALVYVLALGTAAAPVWRSVPEDRRLLRLAEDPRGVVSLVETADGGVRLGIDNRTLLRGTPGALMARRMARLSAALAPQAREALVLGLGDGQLPAELATLVPGTVTCVDRIGELVALADELPWSRGPDAPRPELVHDEPLRQLLVRRGAWPLIVVAPEEPGRPGAGGRLSREHDRAMREALAPDGVAVQWLPLHAMPWPAFASAAHAFLDAFPDARLFVGSLRADDPVVALVGGLGDGLPGAAVMDGVLAGRPSPAGLLGAPDVHDLYLADGWTLLTRLRDAPAASSERPWPELLSMRRAADEAALARINLRLLADLAVPLDTASMQVRPSDEKVDKALGVELVARSRAAVALLAARATGLELRDTLPGALSADERDALEDAWHTLLVQAWTVAPGHLDARDALLERALALTRDGRWERAAVLLDAALEVLADGSLQGLQCGILLKLERVEDAVRVGREAVARQPGDRTALLNLGSALVFAHEDEQALALLSRARDAFRPQALPPLHIAVLGLLEGDPESVALARTLVGRLPPAEPWTLELRRLLERAPAAGG